MTQATLEGVEAGNRSAFGWRRLAMVVAAAAGVGHAVIAAAYWDLDALFIAVSFAVASWLLQLRRGTIGCAVLALASANVVFWTVPASLANVSSRAGFWPIAVPGTMAVLALTGLVAAVGMLVARRRGVVGEVAARSVSLVAAVGMVAVISLGLMVDTQASGAEPGDLELITDGNAFSDSDLVVPEGTVGVYLENHDYFWHTFTVNGLDVDLRVPVGASGRVVFEAAPGTYDFVCAIPGHETAGMVGTLTVVGK